MTSISLSYPQEVNIRSLCRPICRVSFQGVAVLGRFPEQVSLAGPEGCGHVGGHRNRLALVSQNVTDKEVVVHLGFNELATLFIGKSSSLGAEPMC